MKFSLYLSTFCLIWLGCGCLPAQEQGLTWPASQRLLLDHPAMVGFSGQNHLYLGAYKKWFGMDQAPSTYYLGGAAPLGSRRIGLGGFLLRDQVGLLTQTRLSAFAAAHSAPDRVHRFSVGASASWQSFRASQANVVDLIGPEGLQGSRLNLGLAFNYRLHLGDDGSWLNLQGQVPQLFSEVVLGGSTDSMSLIMGMPSQYVLQANLRQALGGGNYLLPSLRLYLHEGKLGERQALFDLGVGLSFIDDLLQVGLGYRNAQASRLYAGLGIRLGETLDATLALEPGGPLGLSGGADIQLTFGEKTTTQPSVPWHLQPFWEERVRAAGLLGYYEVTTLHDKKSVYVSYSFDDNDDLLYNLASDPPLKVEEFLTELQQAIQAVQTQRGQLIRLDLTAELKTGFSDTVDVPYSGEKALLLRSYYQEGLYQPPTPIAPGAALNEGQLAAIKLQYFKESLAKQVSALSQTVLNQTQLNIEFDPSITYNRRITVRVVFNK